MNAINVSYDCFIAAVKFLFIGDALKTYKLFSSLLLHTLNMRKHKLKLEC